MTEEFSLKELGNELIEVVRQVVDAIVEAEGATPDSGAVTIIAMGVRFVITPHPDGRTHFEIDSGDSDDLHNLIVSILGILLPHSKKDTIDVAFSQ